MDTWQQGPFVYIQPATPNGLASDSTKHSRHHPSPSKAETEIPKKKKRQQDGYACDKCRERRVGCDRAKPVCGQCRGKRTCVYSNHATRVESKPIRERMDSLQHVLEHMSKTLYNLEQHYQVVISQFLQQVQPAPNNDVTWHTEMLSITKWAQAAGWPVATQPNGVKSIYTDIKSIQRLQHVLYEMVERFYQNESQISLGPVSPTVSTVEETPSRLPVPAKSYKFQSVYEYLNIIDMELVAMEYIKDIEPRYYDFISQWAEKHHNCIFPTLVSPSRFQQHHSKGQISLSLLVSICCHTIPHSCVYHPNLLQIPEPIKLAQKFYNYTRSRLDPIEPTAKLSSIYQLAKLVTFDLDCGHTDRAFLHLGIAIRLCFTLNLHRPEGYVHCKSPFEREQAKRIFWSIWFEDSLVPQLTPRPRSIRWSDVSVSLPTILSDFDEDEIERTRFAISFIIIRRLYTNIIDTQDKGDDDDAEMIQQFEAELDSFYINLAPQNRFDNAGRVPSTASLWARRTVFCVLLDYCICWVALYRPLIESTSTLISKQASQYTLQAAMAMLILFDHWFQVSIQSSDGFDCYFRMYYYHFITMTEIFRMNIIDTDSSPLMVKRSREGLAKALVLYRQFPHSRNRQNKLENDLVEFMRLYHMKEEEAFADTHGGRNPLADHDCGDGGWRIFSLEDHEPFTQWQDHSKNEDSITDSHNSPDECLFYL